MQKIVVWLLLAAAAAAVLAVAVLDLPSPNREIKEPFEIQGVTN